MLLDKQATLYLRPAPAWAYMANGISPSLRQEHELFARRAKYLRTTLGGSQADEAVEMKRRGFAKTQKTASNVERSEHDSRLSTYAAKAALYGVPLWMMFLPGLTNEMLHGERGQRLKTLIEDYLHADDENRKHIENMASGFAALGHPK